MKTSPINLEIKSDLSEISEAMEKLRAIADVLPVTVGNFIAGTGGIMGLVEQRIAPPTGGVVWFLARPTVKLQRFLEMFDTDDLAPVTGAVLGKVATSDLTAHQNLLITEALCKMATDKTPERFVAIRCALITEFEELNRQTLPASLARLHKSL